MVSFKQQKQEQQLQHQLQQQQQQMALAYNDLLMACGMTASSSSTAAAAAAGSSSVALPNSDMLAARLGITPEAAQQLTAQMLGAGLAPDNLAAAAAAAGGLSTGSLQVFPPGLYPDPGADPLMQGLNMPGSPLLLKQQQQRQRQQQWKQQVRCMLGAVTPEAVGVECCLVWVVGRALREASAPLAHKYPTNLPRISHESPMNLPLSLHVIDGITAVLLDI